MGTNAKQIIWTARQIPPVKANHAKESKHNQPDTGSLEESFL